MYPTISVVIPVHEASALLDECLSSLEAGFEAPLECIVVDDGSTDNPARVALRHGATLIVSPERRGPAHARNLGARAARGDAVVFLDADVLPPPDMIARVRGALEERPDLDAVIGSYDDEPASQGFVSQYKNLIHCFVHRSGRPEASTFWSGCGAVRRHVFLSVGGFDETYDRPAIEDIELGYRLKAAGHEIALRPDLAVKHLKHWTLSSMIRCDIFDRAVPWTELIWRDRNMPNDLNLRTNQRVCVGIAGLLAVVSVLAAGALFQDLSSPVREATLFGLLAAWLFGTASLVWLNRSLFGFLAERRGTGFALAAIPLQVAFFFYSGLAFVIGTVRYTSGLVEAPAEILPLEPDEEPATAKSA